jgi:hypothetical protein
MVDIVVKVEPSLQDRDVPGVRPVGDEHLVILKEGADRIPQQGGVVSGKGRDDEHRGRGGCAPRTPEVEGVPDEVRQSDPGTGPGLDTPDADVDSVDPDAVYPPLGAAIAACEVGEEVG